MRDRPESTRDSSAVPFHKQIEALRKERGYTKKEVADAAGMSLKAYSNFSLGKLKEEPHPRHKRAMREFFGMDAPRAAAPSGPPVVSLEDDELPKDVKQFRNFVTAYLLTMSEDERDKFMADETKRWLAIRMGQPV